MSALGRTLAATLLFALALVALLALPRRAFAPLRESARQSAFELDEAEETSGAATAVPRAR